MSCDEGSIRGADLDIVSQLGEPSRDSQLGESDSQSECLSETNSSNYSGESDYTDSMNGTNTDSDDDKASEITTDSFREVVVEEQEEVVEG